MDVIIVMSSFFFFLSDVGFLTNFDVHIKYTGKLVEFRMLPLKRNQHSADFFGTALRYSDVALCFLRPICCAAGSCALLSAEGAGQTMKAKVDGFKWISHEIMTFRP